MTDPPALRLADSESRISRQFILHWPRPFEPSSDGSVKLEFGYGLDDIRVWERLRRDDLLLLLAWNNRPQVFACAVRWKSITPRSSPLGDHAPFIVSCSLIGTSELDRIPADLFFNQGILSTLPHSVFKSYWEACSPQPDTPIPNRATIWSDKNCSVFVADRYEDFQYILKTAASHPFGPAIASFTFIIERDGIRAGALLAEPASRLSVSHRAAWRLFREYYTDIRSDALNISRIYSLPGQWKIQAKLLDAFIQIAPTLVERELSIVEGVSYDYHPLLRPRGFWCIPPTKLFDSFYYFKPWYLPRHATPSQVDWADQRKEIGRILETRRERKFWIIRARQDNIDLAEHKQAWALRGSVENRRKWASISVGDALFFKRPDDKIVAYALVAKTENRTVREFENYPFWIDVDGFTRCTLDISRHATQDWYRSSERGGIVKLPEEFGARLRSLVRKQTKEGRMWVEPNPYLLRNTDFDERPNQIFVVQSWELRDSVLPVIKEIMAPLGYEVAYSGDRGGQVIFEDIWLMLNESSVVLVDFTKRRPNVYLEYGMALVLGKPIVSITQDKEDIPSDTPNLKYILYNDALGDRSLETQLPGAIRDTVADLERARERTGR